MELLLSKAGLEQDSDRGCEVRERNDSEADQRASDDQQCLHENLLVLGG